MSPDYELLGGYFDKRDDRAIPNFAGIVKSTAECKAIAVTKGHEVFGVQNKG